MSPNKPKQVRIPEDLEQRIEAHAERLRKEAPAALRITWSDAARDLLERGLATVEAPARRKRSK